MNIVFLGDIKYPTTQITEITEDIIRKIEILNGDSNIDFLKRNKLFPLSVKDLKRSTFDELIILKNLFSKPIYITDKHIHNANDELVFDEHGRLVKRNNKKTMENFSYFYNNNDLDWNVRKQILSNGKLFSTYRNINGNEVISFDVEINLYGCRKRIYTILENGSHQIKEYRTHDERYSIFDSTGNAIESKDELQTIYNKYIRNEKGQIVEVLRKYSENDEYKCVHEYRYDGHGNCEFSKIFFGSSALIRTSQHFYEPNGKLIRIITDTINSFSRTQTQTIECFLD